MNRNKLFGRAATIVASVALPVVVVFSSVTPASAAGAAALTLSGASNGSWAASGSAFDPGRSDVQLWVRDITGGGWSTLEQQSGLHTSVHVFRCYTPTRCFYNPGGQLTANGAVYPLNPPWATPWPVHTLSCAHSYQAVAYDPADGYSYSNVLTEPACPAPPR